MELSMASRACSSLHRACGGAEMTCKVMVTSVYRILRGLPNPLPFKAWREVLLLHDLPFCLAVVQFTRSSAVAVQLSPMAKEK
jgi:hypothetical protein